MPRGPGSAPRLRLPNGWPRTAPAIVWSYSDGRWWRVDAATDIDTARRSAALRMLNARNGTAGSRALGTRPLPPSPGARFVATGQHENPDMVWQRQLEEAS